MGSLKHAIETQSHQLQVMELEVNDLEDFAADSQAYSKPNNHLQDKVDDLEDCAHQNNLRLISIPESIKAPHLLTLFMVTIPQVPTATLQSGKGSLHRSSTG